MKAPLLRQVLYIVVSLSVLFFLFKTFPHVAEDPSNSRFQHLSMLIDAANQGYFLQISPGHSINEHLYEDPGLGSIVTFFVLLTKLFFSDAFTVSWQSVYGVQYAIYAFFLIVCCLADKKSYLAPFAVLSIVVSFYLGQSRWSYFCYWAPPLAVLVAYAVVICLARLACLSRWYVFFSAVSFGLLAGVLGLCRQDALLIARASIAAVFVLLAGGVIWSRIRRRIPGPASLPDATKKVLLYIVLFLGCTYAPPLAYEGALMVHQRHSGIRHDANQGNHGIWHALYVGLGYVPNKYGIVFSDGIGTEHVRKEDPSARFGSKEYMAVIKKMYLRIITNDPHFFFKTVLAKAKTLVFYLGGSYAVASFLVLSLVFVVFSMARAVDLGTPFAFFPFLTFLIASAPPILVIPVYNTIEASQTAFISSFFFTGFFLLQTNLARLFSFVENIKSYCKKHWKPLLCCAVAALVLFEINTYHNDNRKIALARNNLRYLDDISKIAMLKSDAQLKEITGNSCSVCPCRGGRYLKFIDENDICYANWIKAVTSIWKFASGESAFGPYGNIILPATLLEDPWGSPYGLDENTGLFRSAGPDGIFETSDDIRPDKAE